MSVKVFSPKLRPASGIIVATLILFVIWMSLGAYQSHYISGLRTLGDTSTQSIIGSSKEGRGDEWSTYLPILKQAYLEGFPSRSTLEPYFEKLDWFIAIPHKNLSLLFLPNQLAYWIFPGGKALSLQGFYYNALFIFSAAWLLVNLGIRRSIAYAVAITLLFTQFYQLWWTSNFPTLGASLLPFAILTSGLRLRHKSLLLYWAICHMLFGEMYPPFYISLAVALTPFVVAVKPSIAKPRQVLTAIAAAVAALITYVAVNWDFVKAVSGTSYPGHRINVGGGSTLNALAALFFPTLPQHAVGDPDAAMYTLSVAGTFLPLLFLSILPWAKWDRSTVRVTVVTVLAAAVISAYMIFGFPLLLSKLTGFYLVPGPRMAFGISVLIAFYFAFMISKNWDEFRVAPLFVCAVGYAAIAYYVGIDDIYTKNFFGIKFYPYMPIVMLVIGVLIASVIRAKSLSKAVAACLIIGMTLVHVVVFGSFNPIINAKYILDPVDSQITRDWRALWIKNGERPFAVIGNYGHLLRGEDLPALEAIHLASVNESIYGSIFTSLSALQIDQLFNQFRGIAFANTGSLNATGATVVFPIKKFSVPFENVVAFDDGGSKTLLGGRPNFKLSSTEPGSFVVRWNSYLAQPLAIESPLTLWVKCPVSNSWVTRYPVSIAGRPLVRVALQGIAGEMTVSAQNSQAAEKCLANFRVTTDGKFDRGGPGSGIE